MTSDQNPHPNRIKILHDGFVELIDHMGSDESICNAARLSYGKTTPPKSDDRTLLRYLMRHHHTSPFEMAELKFYVRVPIDIWRQWARHRMASINEHSTRYTEPVDVPPHVPNGDEWRLQSQSNKQGSDGMLNPVYGRQLSAHWEYLARGQKEAYNKAIAMGVSREQARGGLVLSSYTDATWKIDLHNLMHFLRLRLDSHAQQEIREYAAAILDLVEPLFPLTMEAFYDYRLHSMQLSALDILAIQKHDWTGETFSNARERKEYLAKVERLGLQPLN